MWPSGTSPIAVSQMLCCLRPIFLPSALVSPVTNTDDHFMKSGFAFFSPQKTLGMQLICELILYGLSYFNGKE